MGGGSTITTGATATRKQKHLLPKNSISKIKSKSKKNVLGNKKSKADKKKNENEKAEAEGTEKMGTGVVQLATASQQLSFFTNQYESANGFQLSTLELDSIKVAAQDITTSDLDEHVKTVFGSSWKRVLCEKNLREGQVDPGNPALLVISSSALRSLELIRKLRSLTKECHAAKLFSKHMKVEEQVSVLKNRVNIASGTPSRIKKLIDMEALCLSRLELIVLDMHTDVKGYSLFTLPQVRDEFWDLYRTYFHQPLLQCKLRFCLYGPVPTNIGAKKKRPKDD